MAQVNETQDEGAGKELAELGQQLTAAQEAYDRAQKETSYARSNGLRLLRLRRNRPPAEGRPLPLRRKAIPPHSTPSGAGPRPKAAAGAHSIPLLRLLPPFFALNPCFQTLFYQ